MARRRKLSISRRLGNFRGDRAVFIALVLVTLLLAGRSWLHAHPEHNPWAPLDLDDPVGWATWAKFDQIKGDLPACRAVLERSQVAYRALEPQGDGQCRREDRTVLADYPLAPQPPPTTCPVAVGLELWKRQALDPLAQEIFGADIRTIEHLGAYSCRRTYGRSAGAWSEHATGNAIDIAGFTLDDGTTIRLERDWGEGTRESKFLEQVRDRACEPFSTVLSPDYNAAHSDHLHMDMDDRWSGFCR